MEVSKHRAKLLKNVASLPGSRDRVGGPVVVVDPPQGNVGGVSRRSSSALDLGAGTGGAPGAGVFFPYEDLVSLLGYLQEIPDRSTAAKGFCLLIDGRNAHSKVLRNILRGCQQALYKKIRMALIIQPEKFLNQQKINMDVIMEGYDFKVILLSLHKLSKYIDISQLPANFGGTFPYEAENWVEKRERIESLLSRLSTRRLDFSSAHPDSQAQFDDNEDVFREAESYSSQLSQSTVNGDDQAAAGLIRGALEAVKVAALRPEREAQVQREMVEQQEKNRMLEEHAEGVNRLLDWIEGAGEKWLLTLHEIGESKDEARQLVKEHEQLHKKSQEVVSHGAELGELATRLMAAVPAHAITLEKARDQVKSVTDHFSERVDRQMEMARRSEQLHSLIAQLSRKTDLLLESLCTDPKVSDAGAAEQERAAIEEKVAVMEKIYGSVCETGGAFVEELAVAEYNTMGRKITRDYSAGIVHIRDQLAAARERRTRCLDLVDVRRLKLQQFLQLFTCHDDALQAISWLEELQETLLKDYNQLGCDEHDLQCLREDRMKLEETARSTYEYGKQLCQVAMVLRRSLRMDNTAQSNLPEKLEQTWARLCRALSDNEAKLNVTDAFNSTIVEINRRVIELEKRLKQRMQPGRSNDNLLVIERKRLAGDIRELSHIRDMLTAQINANHTATVEARQAAISGIRRKVDDVENAQRRMESLFTETPLPIADQTTNYNHSTPNLRSATQAMGSIRLSDTESYL